MGYCIETNCKLEFVEEASPLIVQILEGAQTLAQGMATLDGFDTGLLAIRETVKAAATSICEKQLIPEPMSVEQVLTHCNMDAQKQVNEYLKWVTAHPTELPRDTVIA